ncbi:TonB-dependent receptor [Ekhidna sp.]|uniref:TonB-dependent receptor n=1 Tax=Ekhidna sp. TaxID=2608089 RepID=UPI00329977A8
MKKILLTVTFVLSIFALIAQGVVTGKVADTETGEGLPGATVLIEGTTLGTVTDINGDFSINVPSRGSVIVISYIGFKDVVINLQDGQSALGTINMEAGITQLSTLEIIASRSTQETPYTFTDLEKKDIQQSLGSRDLPLVLNAAPSFYSTNQGGGAGDARLNVRGFNQRNVAIMINGVPVNDMENGWVFWSNWDGLGDAAQSIQLQRGMSPVNLAVPSIGGTLNIITDPASRGKGTSIKQEVGSWNFRKTTASFNSGLMNEKWALSGTVVRKTGDGFYSGLYTDAWAYYLGASYQLNDNNKFEAFLVGAPQAHGQNLYRQNIGVYDRAFALGLDSYEVSATNDFFEQGRDFNQNYGGVDASYNGKQYWGMYNSLRSRSRSGANYLMERENFFHKPQFNLNWYHSFNENMQWTTVAYWSGGQGGGSGTFGEVIRKDAYGVNGTAQPFFFGPSPWEWDWNATIAINQGLAQPWTNDFDTGNKQDGESIGILRNSRNNQWTIGAISKLFWDLNENLSLQFGVDWRTASIDHFREVRDLLGGEYFRYTGNQFETNEGQYRKRLGERIDYSYVNTVDWIGTFAQGTYTADALTVSLTTGFTSTKYSHENFFLSDNGTATGSTLKINPGSFTGYQVKGGVSYKVNEDLNVYANGGFISQNPNFDRVIDDESFILFDDPQNQEFKSFEGGLTYRLGTDIVINANYYNTLWSNRTQKEEVENPNTGADIFALITGIEQRNTGVEFEASWKPNQIIRVDAAASFGNWKFTDDTGVTITENDANGNVVDRFNETLYIKDLKVGDAPQTQFYISGTFTPSTNLTIKADYRFYDNFYSDFNPIGRTALEDANNDGNANERPQAWQVPSYGVVDLHAFYTIPTKGAGFSLQVFAHVFNAFDKVYIQDAGDNSQFNAFDGDHDADDAEVFFGLPRNFNAGIQINF